MQPGNHPSDHTKVSKQSWTSFSDKSEQSVDTCVYPPVDGVVWYMLGVEGSVKGGGRAGEGEKQQGQEEEEGQCPGGIVALTYASHPGRDDR